MSYEMRRLHLHGLIERLTKTHRHRLTEGARGCTLPEARTAHGVVLTRVHARILRRTMAQPIPDAPAESPRSFADSSKPKPPTMHGAIRPTSVLRKLASITAE
jgi:hypothetical protein